MEIRPRDVIVSTSLVTRGEQELHHVKLTHKPTGTSGEYTNADYDQARAGAQDALDAQLKQQSVERELFR